MNPVKHIEAITLWKWLEPRLPQSMRDEAQQFLEPNRPSSTQGVDSEVDKILDDRLPMEQRLVLMKDLLQIIKDGQAGPSSVPKSSTPPKK